jgi:hypothetical protein
MDKEYLENSIKKLEESIKISEQNEKDSHNHTEEGKLVLETLQNKLKEI